MLWVESESDKLALTQDPASPFFTTAHFDGHPSVLVRASRLAEIGRTELTELIQDAWLSRAFEEAGRSVARRPPLARRPGCGWKRRELTRTHV